jgi:UDP-N-acetylglucosamine/UDP-N-acetylgalactosamine diphosphorylase
MNQTTLSGPVAELLARGVQIPDPLAVHVGQEVDPGRISARGVVLHPGTRISGAKTLILAGVKLGAEGPVTLADCRLGAGVELKGGFFSASVFLDRAVMGSGAQVREGCLLEEEAGGGHTVGLKQTLLMPFVTLGSLINFCDILMAGGTSRRDHSEVGSSYIHFNYTPNQDKATASLLGDVPRGVMLREPPIFLGGQGGLVGPSRIGFGAVIAAGVIQRHDCPEGGMLLRGKPQSDRSEPFHPGLYGAIGRKVANNVRYIANVLALRQWYLHVRRSFAGDPEMGDQLWSGAVDILDGAVAERVARLGALAQKMERSLELGRTLWPQALRGACERQQREFGERWPDMEAALTGGAEAGAGLAERDGFLVRLERCRHEQGEDYLRTVRALDREALALGTAWLERTVDAIAEEALACVPACREGR